MGKFNLISDMSKKVVLNLWDRHERAWVRMNARSHAQNRDICLGYEARRWERTWLLDNGAWCRGNFALSRMHNGARALLIRIAVV